METVHFAVYDLSANAVYGVSYSTMSNPGNDIGYPPDMLPIAAISSGGTIPGGFPRPWDVVTYTNTTVAYCEVTIDGVSASVNDEVGVFVGSECRGTGSIVLNDGITITTMNIQGESIETVNFAVYDASMDAVYNVAFTTQTMPGGNLGYPPNLLPVHASSSRGLELSHSRTEFPRPWSVVNYTNSTVAYCNVTIDGELAAVEDQVGVFVGTECRGIGYIELIEGQSISSMNIQGELAETVHFAVYDSSVDEVIGVSYTTMTSPGNDLGYPPNLLPIAAATEIIPVLANCFTGETLDVLFPIGEYEVTLTVTDDDGATDSETTVVTVIEHNYAPVADADGPYQEDADFNGLGLINLDGSGSYDLDGEIVNYEWCWYGQGSEFYPRPWLPVVYSNSTIAYGVVTIDGENAAEYDEVGAFINGECRGIGYVNIQNSDGLVTMNIQGEEPEIVHFAVYDVSEDEICQVSYYTQTDPGNDIGYPPDLLPIASYTSGYSQGVQVFPRPWNVVNYTNSTVAYGEVTIDGIPASPGDEVGAFVDGECRSVGYVVDNDGQSIVSMNIQGESVELVNFAVWDASVGEIAGVSFSTFTNPGYNIGYPPDLLPIAASGSLNRNEFPRPWAVVNYTNSTVAYGEVTINGFPASPGDEVGAFVGDECRGTGTVTDDVRTSIVSLNIQGETVEIVNFAVWDESENEVLQVVYTTMTNPGHDIGYPPNLLPIAASSEIQSDILNCVQGEYVDVYFPTGTYEVTLTVTDDDGAVATDQTTVTINDYNYIPVADANGPYEAVAETGGVAGVQLDGSGSYDLDGSIVNYEWCWLGGGSAIFPRPWTVVNYTNSTVAYSRVTIDGENATIRDQVGAFVGSECRAIGSVFIDNNHSYSTFNIQGEIEETVNFAVFDYSENQVWSVSYYTQTNPGNDIGYPPDFLPINAVSTNGSYSYAFPRPWNVVNYTNSTVAYGRVTIDGLMAAEEDEVCAFINNECRGVGFVTLNRTESIVTLNIQGETIETVHFAVYDQSANAVYGVNYYTQTDPGGDIGFPPDLIPLAALSSNRLDMGLSRSRSFPRPWQPVYYTNSTVAYGRVTIDGANADLEDQVGAFINNQCRGVGDVAMNEGLSIVSMNIQGESVETVNFAVYDASEDEVLSVTFTTQTHPGGDIGLPPDLLPIAASTVTNYNCVTGVNPLVYYPVGTYFVTLTVTDDRGATDSDLTTVTVTEYNYPPVADAGGPYEEIASIETGIATVNFDGSGSYDIDGEIVNYEWCWGGTPGTGSSFPRPWNEVIYTNTTLAYGEVTINGNPASPGDEVGAFVDGECRGIGYVTDDARTSIVSLNIQGESVELVHFAVYDASEAEVVSVYYTTMTNPGYDIGYPPDLLPIAAVSNSRASKTIAMRTEFPRPWNEVIYTNTTLAYGEVTINGNPASPGDEVGAFVNYECRGIGYVTDDARTSIVSINIQGESVELVQFAVYDVSEDEVVSVYYTTMTNPGYDIGYPPNLLPIAAYSESTDEICIYGESPSYDFLPGEYEVTLTVTDNDGDTASDVTIVTILSENIPPVADAGEDYFEQAQDGYAEVTLDGSGSYDMDGDIVSYYWNWEGGGVVIFPRPWTPVVYTNSTIAYGIVTIDGEPAGAGDQVAAFVGNECRGVANVTLDTSRRVRSKNTRDLISRVTLNIQGEAVEQVQFAVWDYSNDQVYSVGNTYMTDPGGDIGYPPNELQINASSFARSRLSAIGEMVTVVFPIGIYNVDLTVTDNAGATDSDEAIVTVGAQAQPPHIFPRPWEVVTYSNSTVAYGIVTIDEEPAAVGDEVAAFVGNQCRAVASVYHIDDGRQREISAHVTMNIQGEVVELVRFAVWDASADEVLSVAFSTYTNPGFDIGYPPDELPIAATRYPRPNLPDYPWYINPNIWDDFTTAVCTVFIDDLPAATGDMVGAFDLNGIPRGEGEVTYNGSLGLTTFNILGDYPEVIYFAVWDESADFMCYVHEYTYSAPGDTLYLTINAYTNMLPVAVPGGPYIAQADLTGLADVTLDGSGSYDFDGEIVSYQWIFNSNVISEAELFTYAFEVGLQTVTLVVTDDDGGIGSSEFTVEVISMENEPPVAIGDNYEIDEDNQLLVTTVNGVLINDIDTVPGGWPDSLSAVLTDNVIHGSLEFNADGSFIYTPVQNYSGQDRFRYMAYDGIDYSEEALVLINIIPVNDPPVADANGPYSGQIDVSGFAEITLDGSGSYDLDGEIISYLWTWNDTITASGVTATGIFPFGPTIVYLTVTDNNGATDTDSSPVGISDYINIAPIAVADSFYTMEDQSLVVSTSMGIMINDTDDGYPGRLVAVLADSTSNGTLIYDVDGWDGAFTYIPDTNFNGVDQFAYYLYDGQTFSNVVLVTINVESVNDLPVADAGGPYQTTADNNGYATVTIDASSSYDLDGSIVLYQWTWGGNNIATGMILEAVFPVGTTIVTLTVVDDSGDSDTDTALVGVAQYNNQIPVAINDAYETNEDDILNVDAEMGVLANDTDDDFPEALQAVLLDDPANGTLILNSDGSFIYTPESNFNGTDTFTYAAYDGQTLSPLTQVVITINSINDEPVADAGGPYNGQADQSDTALITLDASGSYDVENSIVSYQWSWSDGSAEGEIVTISFPVNTTIVTLTVTDSEGAIDTDTALVGVASYNNQLPVSVSDQYETDEDVILTISADLGVLANDTDDDYPETLTAVLIDGTLHGLVSLNSDGSFEYIPQLNYFGTDQFSYTAFDGETYSGITYADIIINSVNDNPVADAGGTYNGVADTTDTAIITLDGSGSYDLDGEIVSWLWSWDSGTTSRDRNRETAEGEIVAASFPAGTTPVTLTVTDNQGASNRDSTVVSVASYGNLTPVALPDAYTVLEDSILIINTDMGVLANDTDDNYPLLLTAVLAPNGDVTNGTLSLQASGAFIYAPDPGFVGFDYFEYMAYDGDVNSPAVTVTIEVINVNDPPEIVLPDFFTFNEDEQLIEDFASYISDVDSPELQLYVDGNVNINIVIDQLVVTFSAPENWYGNEVIYFTVDDMQTRLTATDSVNVIVNSVNDDPVLVQEIPDYYLIEDFDPFDVNLSDYFQDVDNELTYMVDYEPLQISALINQELLTISSVLNWYGETEVVVTAEDGIYRSAVSDTFMVYVAMGGMQVFDLIENWNWISFNVHPEDTSLNGVFDPLSDNVNVVKNQTQSSLYIPEYNDWMGDLDYVTDGEGYLVQMNQGFQEFVVNGSVIPASTPIEMLEDWNWIAYYPHSPDSLSNALASILDNVETVKDQQHSADYYPDWDLWLGDLDTMQPGVGYKVKLTQSDELIYPALVTRNAQDGSSQNSKFKIQNSSLRWEIMPGTEDNMIAMAQMTTPSGNIMPLNDVSCAVFDINGNCRSNGYWQFVPQLNYGFWYFTIVGNIENEPLHFVYYDSEGFEHISEYELIFNADTKLGNPYNLLSIEFNITEGGEDLDVPDSYILNQNYPNPFSLKTGDRDYCTSFRYGLPVTGQIVLSLYNIKGQKVCDIVNEVQDAGFHVAEWDGTDSKGNSVAAGLYFYHLKSAGTSLHRKLIIIK
ncbi:MAG: tandem-95 repeat protein [Candidatus Cloacimonetes bacterium]|nr:tandem-95 repeat protein [Candidatus Cloacimonadota bacterium]